MVTADFKCIPVVLIQAPPTRTCRETNHKQPRGKKKATGHGGAMVEPGGHQKSVNTVYFIALTDLIFYSECQKVN